MTKLYAPQDSEVPSDDILHLINLSQSGQPFMPRLQLLHWTTSRAFLPWLHLLLSPSLSDIHIDFNGGRTTPVNVAVVKVLPTTELKHIAFSTLHTNAEIDAALLDLVLRTKRLESIYLQQEANTEDASSPGDGVEDERLERIELDSLKSIIIGVKNEIKFLPNFFNGTTLPNVQYIYLKHSGRTEWSDASDLFGSILRSASPSALHTLRYTSHYHGMDITSARIYQLRSFTALKTLRITSACGATGCKFFLSDDDVSTIAFAMPNLVELHLGGAPCDSTSVAVSVDGLAILAANCIRLAELQIHFDTIGFINRALDVSSQHVGSARLTQNSCQLTQLNVGRIPLGKGMDGYWTIGTALLQIFPNLKSIKFYEQAFSLARDWGEVMRIIKVQRNLTDILSSTMGEPTLVHTPSTST